MLDDKKQKINRKLNGIVVGSKTDKTIVVKVERKKWNTKYKKQYKESKKYSVHDEKNECKEGDIVTFIQCRPLSKTKRWRLVKQ